MSARAAGATRAVVTVIALLAIGGTALLVAEPPPPRPRVEYPQRTKPPPKDWTLMMFADYAGSKPAVDYFDTSDACNVALADWTDRAMRSHPNYSARVTAITVAGSSTGDSYPLVMVGHFFALCARTSETLVDILRDLQL